MSEKMTDDRAESFAKYHDEHASYGGVAFEFHARAATFIRDQAAHIATLEAGREHWRSEAMAHDIAATQYEGDIATLRKELERERAWKESARLERDDLRHTIEELHAVLGTDDGTPHGPGLLEAARELRMKAEESEALRERAERAEADNAALAVRLQAVCDAAMQTDWMGPGGEREARFPWDEIEFALRGLHQNHPGAALMSELSRLRGQLRAVAGSVGLEDGDTLKDAVERIVARAKPIPGE